METKDTPIPAERSRGTRRQSTARQNLMIATLLVPIGATMTLAAAKVVLRHRAAPMVATAPAKPLPTMIAAAPSRPRPPAARSQVPGDSDRVLAVNEARLRRDPGDIEARGALVEAAIAARQTARADMLARQAVQQNPSEPRVWMVSAEVARAQGASGRARQELERARSLRLQQLGYSDNGDDDSTLPAVTLSPGGAPYRGQVTTQPRWTRPAGGVQYAQNDPNLAAPPGFGSPTSLAAPAPPLSPSPGFVSPMLDTRPTELVQPVGSAPFSPAPFSPAPFSPAPFSPEPFSPEPLAAPAEAGGSGLGNFNASGNPFRRNSGDSLSPAGSSGITDPLTQQIDREIAALNGQVDPAVQAGFGFRVRSGDDGLSGLTEFTVPLQAEYSPGGYGRLTVAVTPTFLMAGKVGAGIANQQQFGTGAFNFATAGNQSAQGTALNVRYAYGDLSADVGSTPLGFRIQNVVGGAQWTPKLTDNVSLRIIGERRAITDSLLSYAGAVDPTTGVTWGGVTRTRGRVNIEASAGLGNLYAGAGGGILRGTHVQRNSEIEAGAGGSYPVWRNETQEIRLGVDFAYLSFDKNLGGFTLGQGGYFSPQQFFAAIVPVNFRHKVSDDLTYEVGGGVGVQSFRNRSSAYYPIDPGLQAALVTRQSNAATVINGVGTIHSATHNTGIAGNAHAMVDYRINPNLHLVARVAVEHAGDYTEGSGLIYARYVFSDAGRTP